METITVPLIWGTTRVDVCGQRMLVGAADTGVFRIVDVGGRRRRRQQSSRGRDIDDALALATIAIDGPLEVADRNTGHDPYNRHGRRVR